MTSSERGPAPPAPARPGPLRLTGTSAWDRHPGVRTGRRLSPGERAADLVCRVAGSGTYQLTTAVVAAVLLLRPAGAGLVCVVVVQVTVLLVAARRAERIATDLALFHLDQSRRATAVAEDLRAELQSMRADVARITAATQRAGHL
jgi:hypothetical protein